jgi:hypothetical protein
MIITATIEGDDEGSEVASLYRWLISDPEVRSAAGLSLEADGTQAGQMGSGLDLVQAVLSDGIGAASLVVSVASWRATRPKHIRVILRQGDKEVSVETDDADAAIELARRIMPAEVDGPGAK